MSYRGKKRKEEVDKFKEGFTGMTAEELEKSKKDREELKEKAFKKIRSFLYD